MYSLDSFTPPQEGLDELRDYVFLSVSAMPARIQIVIPDEWLVLFEQLIELHAKLGLVTTKSEIGREIIGMGMDAYRARINAIVAAVPKRPPVVLGPGGLVGAARAPRGSAFLNRKATGSLMNISYQMPIPIGAPSSELTGWLRR